MDNPNQYYSSNSLFQNHLVKGIHASNAFEVPSGFGITYWEIEHNGGYPWRNTDETIVYPDVDNLQSINGVLRNAQMIHLHQLSDFCKSYESGFIDLLNAHNIYRHCPNLGHFNSIGVRGENTIVKNTCIFIIRLFVN